MSRWKLQLSRLNCRFASFGKTHNKIAKHGHIGAPNHDPEPLLLCYLVPGSVRGIQQFNSPIWCPYSASRWGRLNLEEWCAKTATLDIPGPHFLVGFYCRPLKSLEEFLNIHWGLKTSASGIMKPSQVRRKSVEPSISKESGWFPSSHWFCDHGCKPKITGGATEVPLDSTFFNSFNLSFNHLFSGQGWPYPPYPQRPSDSLLRPGCTRKVGGYWYQNCVRGVAQSSFSQGSNTVLAKMPSWATGPRLPRSSWPEFLFPPKVFNPTLRNHGLVEDFHIVGTMYGVFTVRGIGWMWRLPEFGE